MNRSWTWQLAAVDRSVTMYRWGEMGTPLLLFPPNGDDAASVDRGGLVRSLSLLMTDRRVKVYSIDALSGSAWSQTGDPLRSAWIQNEFGKAIRDDVVPRIWEDCRADRLDIVAAGAGLGAFDALGAVCRYPDVFCSAIGMSGTYDLTSRLAGTWSDDFYFSSPLHYLPGLDGHLLDRLRDRFVILATGTGSSESPGESWWMADVLGSKSVPNRVDNWPGYGHDWDTWSAMLPGYVHEVLETRCLHPQS